MSPNKSLKRKTALLSVPSLYGEISIDDPLLQDLILSTPFQRLKGINQYGVVNYICPTENYSRFDHSMGVYLLLKRAGLSLLEQIAGLLHDVSHTVFSHVGDYVFEDHYPGNSYQDDIHLWFLEESGIGAILDKHAISKEQIDHKDPRYKALDRPLPFLCADRIEYNLQGGFLRGLLTKSEFESILESLSFDGEWVLKDQNSALKLANCSLVMTETLWGAPWEALAYRWAAEALRRSFEIGLISFDEFHFSTDDLVWDKLVHSGDPQIQDKVSKMINVNDLYHLTDKGDEDCRLRLKFRGIDPVVITESGKKNLSEIDQSFKKQFQEVKARMEKGWAIRFNPLKGSSLHV